ncbi:MAG: Trp biosynthesis-associated membrane protein, partial [Terrimesophilobacter sp.]
LVGWSQPWYSVTLTGQFAATPTLQVGGDVCAPAVAALALASAAGFAALAISGPFFRLVLAVLEIALGAGVAYSAVLAVGSPNISVSSAVTAVTGLSGTDPVSQLIGTSSATVWPFITVVAGAILIFVGVFIVGTGRSWPGRGRRYEPVRFAPADDAKLSANDGAVSDWDELSGGSDPTSR